MGHYSSLTVPDRIYSELVTDFMTDLPARTDGDPRYMTVIIDHLKGNLAMEAMKNIKADQRANDFLKLHVRNHGFSNFITSDRGSNWAIDFQREVCLQT